MLNKIKKYKKYIYLLIVIICSLIYSNSCIKAKPKEVKYEESLEESSVQEESTKGNLPEESLQSKTKNINYPVVKYFFNLLLSSYLKKIFPYSI